MNSAKPYNVRLTDPRRGRWKWLMLLAMIVGTPVTAVALGVWLDYILGKAAGIMGVLAGIGSWLSISWWYGKWVSDMAAVTIEPGKLVIVKHQTAERAEFLFSELVKYRVLTSFRGSASLRLIGKNECQIALGGAASPEFTALIKEFDAAVVQYERVSRRSITRINMG